MSAAQQVLVALGSSFAVMAVGLAISRAEVLTEPARKGLAKLYASLVFPMMVFKGVAAIDMGAIDVSVALVMVTSKAALAALVVAYGVYR